MAKYQSPFSVDYRKPITLMSNDPRARVDKVGRYEGRVGSEIIIVPAQKSLKIGEYITPAVTYDYWFGSLGASETLGDARSIQIDSSGNVYTLSAVFVVGGPRNMFLTKHNKNGNLLWIKKINSPAIEAGNTAGIRLDASNNIYVYANGTVVDTSVTYSRYILIKYNSNGTLLWQKQEQHNATSGSKTWTEAKSISIDSSGNIYLIGSRRTTTTRYASLIIKYDSSGNILWQKILVGGDSTYGNQGWNSTIDSSDNIYIISRYYPSVGGLTSPQLLIAKLNSAGTSITWQKLLTGGTSAPTYATRARIDSLGNTYVLSYGGTGGGTDPNFLTKYDSAGTRIWVKKISNANATSNPNGYSDFIIDSSDYIYFVGGLGLQSTTRKPTVVKLQSTTGSIVWEKMISQTLPTGNSDILYRLSVDNVNQKILVLGVLNSPTSNLTTFISEIPLNTDFSGTYVIPSTTYSVEATLTVSIVTHTTITDITNTTSSNAATVLTAFTPALTDETAGTTDENFTSYGWSTIGF